MPRPFRGWPAVAVTGAHAKLPWLKHIAVHAQAHRTAGLTPFGARGDEDLMQAFRFGLLLDDFRARHDEHAH